MAPEIEMKRLSPERVIGRYAIYDEIASGGMAVVHLGRMLGQAGFSRTVAIKRLHPQYAKDRSFVAMFLDEARLSVRVQHPNVVAPLDVLIADGEVLVVMEYVAGDTLSRLQRSTAAKERPPSPAVVVSIMSNALYGLHAAHEALGEDGKPLHIVHRDVSPQNIMVGTNGIARVLDFGVAKAAIRSQCTTNGEVKGKLAYMAPEQVEASTLDRRTDVFAAGIVTWETLTRRRLFSADQASETMTKILRARIPAIRKYAPEVSPELESAVLKALEKRPQQRYQTAREFAMALERACAPASPSEVGDWVASVGGDALTSRAERVAAIETRSSSSIIRPLQPPPRVSETVPLQVPPPAIGNTRSMQSQSRITVAVETDRQSASTPNALVAPLSPTVPDPPPAQTALKGLSRGWFALLGLGALCVSSLTIWSIQQQLAPTRKQSRAIAAGISPTANTTQPSTHASSPSQASLGRSDVQPLAKEGASALPSGKEESSAQPLIANRAEAQGAPTQKSLPEPSPTRSATSTNDREKTETRSSNVTRPRTTPQVRRDATSSTETGKAKANCNPPYVVDSAGIRRLKPECL